MSIDFKAKATEWQAVAAASEMQYTPETRTTWLTVNAVHQAAEALAKAASHLHGVAHGADESSPLYQMLKSAQTTFDETEAKVKLIDLARAQADIRYAGSKHALADKARECAELLTQLCASLHSCKAWWTTLTTAATAFAQVATTRKRQAVAKSTFTHSDGCSDVHFQEGEHCDFMEREGSEYVRVCSGQWTAGLKREVFEERFDIVEC